MPQKTIRFTIRLTAVWKNGSRVLLAKRASSSLKKWKLLLERLNVRNPHPKRFCSLRSSPSLFPLN